jgi:hypothetical protein
MGNRHDFMLSIVKVNLNVLNVSTKTHAAFLLIRSTARHAAHLQFDISAKAIEIRAVKTPKCIV